MPVLEHAQVPLQPLLRALLILRIGLVGRGGLQRLVFGANAVGHFVLFLAEALEAIKDLRALMGQFLERAAERLQQFRLRVGTALAGKIGDSRLSLDDRHAARRHFGYEIGNAGIAAPSVGRHIDLRSQPNRVERERRHFNLDTRPVWICLGTTLSETGRRGRNDRDENNSLESLRHERCPSMKTLWPSALRFKLHLRCAVIVPLAVAAFGASAIAQTKAATPPRVAVFNFELLDTSLDGQMLGANRDEASRVGRLAPHLREALAASGRYVVVQSEGVDARAGAQNLQACGGCAEQLAREVGADIAITGQVQKCPI